MNPMARLRKRFSASMLMKGTAATAGLLTVISLSGVGVFLWIEDRKLEQQFELRGASLAQYLARISHRLDPPARGGAVSPKGWGRCDYSGGQES
jgi:hypothetical protein